jgi:hypothetical protein
MKPETNLLRRQMQFELVITRKFSNMQLEIDLLREQITELKIENTRLKNIIDTKEENDITNSDNNYDTASECSTSYYYPRHIQFIINYISSWSENQISKVNVLLYIRNILLGVKLTKWNRMPIMLWEKSFRKLGLCASEQEVVTENGNMFLIGKQ